MTTSDNKIICPKCNSELPQDSGFCQYCGSKIENSSTTIDNVAEENNAPATEKVVMTESETVAKILASGIVEGQKAMEANKESQPHNELDADFGLVPQKPIYTVGIDEQEKYLKSLRTINGEPIKWNRRGSMSVDGVNGMVDVYDIFLPSGEEYKTIYINMYGAYNSTFAPKGFSYSNQLTATKIPMQTKVTSGKSRKIKKFLIISGIVAIIAVLCIAFAIPEINYQRANGLLNEEKFDAARLAFEDLGNYRDSKEMINECLYQQACSLLDDGSYDSAISMFNDLDGYKKSQEKIKEAKYNYVLKHKNNDDSKTYSYLKELKNADYKDSANIFKNLYEWKITVIAINSSETDETTNKTSISRYDAVYFHLKLTGGEPGESVRITAKPVFPDGDVGEYIFEEKWGDGDTLWYGWSDGIYEYPEYGDTGTLRCNFYDENGNLIGAGSVSIVAGSAPIIQKQPRDIVVDWLKNNYETYENGCMTYSVYSDDDSTFYALEYDTSEDHLYMGVSWEFEDGDSMLLLLTLDSDTSWYNYSAIYNSGSYQNKTLGSINASTFTGETVINYDSYTGDYWNKEILLQLYSSGYEDMLNFFDWCLTENQIGVSLSDFGFTQIVFD